MLAILNDIYSTPDAKQDLKPSGVADSGGSDFDIVNRIRTIDEAITFFAKNGGQTDVKFIYCKISTVKGSSDIDPYALETLPLTSELQPVAPYCIVTAAGVIDISPLGTCDFTSFSRFMRDSLTFRILRIFKFFSQYRKQKSLVRFQHLVGRKLRAIPRNLKDNSFARLSLS
jgi:hypothetical protein